MGVASLAFLIFAIPTGYLTARNRLSSSSCAILSNDDKI